MDVKKEIKEHYLKRKVDEEIQKLYDNNEYTYTLNNTLEELKSESNVSNEKLMDSLHIVRKVIKADNK